MIEEKIEKDAAVQSLNIVCNNEKDYVRIEILGANDRLLEFLVFDRTAFLNVVTSSDEYKKLHKKPVE